MNFEEIYQKLFKRVLAYIVSRTGNVDIAEDIACQTWQKTYDKQHQFDSQKGTPEQWIFTIARNEVNRHFRFWQLRRFFSLTEQEDNTRSTEKMPLEWLEQHERQQKLLVALKCLASRERDLVSLKFQSGLNNRQIAAMTGLSESNVGTILNRVVNKLRTQLEGL